MAWVRSARLSGRGRDERSPRGRGAILRGVRRASRTTRCPRTLLRDGRPVGDRAAGRHLELVVGEMAGGGDGGVDTGDILAKRRDVVHRKPLLRTAPFPLQLLFVLKAIFDDAVTEMLHSGSVLFALAVARFEDAHVLEVAAKAVGGEGREHAA
jgi:hypothetical protein